MKISWSLPLDPAGVNGETNDGITFTIRPIRISDGPALEAAFESMSPRSRYLRFFSVRDRLGPDLVKQLTDIDHDAHRAWVVFEPLHDFDDPQDGRLEESGAGVAIARLIAVEGEPGVAEAALVVADAFQGRGFGRLLLELLIGTARDTGVEFIRFETLHQNMGMKRLLDGYEVETNKKLSDQQVAVYDLPVPPDSEGDGVALGAIYDLLRFVARGAGFVDGYSTETGTADESSGVGESDT